MTAWWQQPMRCFICWVLSMKLWGPTGMTSLLSTRRILNEEWRWTLRRGTGVRRTSSRRTMWIIWILRTMYPPFSTTARRTSPRTGRTCCLTSMDFLTCHGLNQPLKIHSPWLMRWSLIYPGLLFLLQVELGMAYGCQLPQERILQYIHFNRHHNTMMINKLREEMTARPRHIARQSECEAPWTKLSTGCYM